MFLVLVDIVEVFSKDLLLDKVCLVDMSRLDNTMSLIFLPFFKLSFEGEIDEDTTSRLGLDIGD